VLLNCSRQSGKSTIAGILALHCALYQPGSLVLVLAPALRQSQELFGKVAGFYRTLSRPVSPT
jgi:phage terminase large subunit-like protein